MSAAKPLTGYLAQAQDCRFDISFRLGPPLRVDPGSFEACRRLMQSLKVAIPVKIEVFDTEGLHPISTAFASTQTKEFEHESQ